ncbi:tetratricopeptide repeat protein [Nonomuraea sp. SBT364]|uniref:tetratricopeptide repeat protein n=1 Tax=Nonomuraea sp. SBT364 TaxID=1580530 RepID=UPI00066B16BD|nr:tetratricopeptide repeat protein [Nonomuraea sp. SBT364]
MTAPDELERAAYEAWDREDWDGAAQGLTELVALLPDSERSPAWWFDLALAHKFRKDWARAYELGKQAAARYPRGEQEPAFWNLGIAATIMRDWATARDAWQGYGLTLPPGDGEIDADLGLACVRLEPDGEPEVVWVRRVCPARARVVSVPLTADRRFGEVVLHDGAPSGERVVDGVRYPVFDELMLWATSDLPTLSVTVTASGADVEELAELFAAAGLGAEPAGNARVLCACCDEGNERGEGNERSEGGEGGEARDRHAGDGTRRVWLAAPPDRAAELLAEWRGRAPGRDWTGLAEAHG